MFRHLYHRLNKQIVPKDELVDRMLTAATQPVVRNKVSRRLTLKPVLASTIIMIVLLAVVVTPAAAARYPSFRRILYQISPEVTQWMTPVNEISISEGIKMEVVAAEIQEDTFKALITLEDLEGGRLDNSIDLNDSYVVDMPLNFIGHADFLGYDEGTALASFEVTLQTMNGEPIEPGKVTFSVNSLIGQKQVLSGIVDTSLSDASTSPEMKRVMTTGGWGSNAAEQSEDDDAHWTGIPWAVVMRPVLNVATQIPGVEISAIGFIDDQLHIQYGVIGKLETDTHGSFFLQNAEGSRIEAISGLSFASHILNKTNRVDYEEVVFDLSAADASDYEIGAGFSVPALHIPGHWQVTFELADKP